MVANTESTELVAAPAEAGFSTNMFLNHPKMGRLQFTFRGATSRDWGNVLEDVDRFLRYMSEKGWRFDGEGKAEQPAPAATTPRTETPAPSNGNGEKKAYEQKPVGAPEGLPEGEYFTDEFDYFVVEPQPDDKATVKFYKDNLKYPVGAQINKWKHERVAQVLGAIVDGFDPGKANKYRVAGKQYWTKGNEYTKQDGTKGHYKDFRAVEQTF